MRAVYKNEHGATFSCPVEVRDGAWVMLTSDGPQPIGYYFDDDAAGRLVFSHYREEPESADSRIHVERGSSWADHKQAFAEQKLAVERKHREEARAEINNQQPDAGKVQQAREINTEIAQRMRPRGKGQYSVND